MVLIENYRGWDISFDTEAETFVVESDDYDDKKVKKSFASAKKFVDDFIKDNANFKEFVVERYDYYSKEKIRIMGISKGKRFFGVNEKGEKVQISNYHEDDYFLVNPVNEPIKEDIEEVSRQAVALNIKEQQLRLSLIKVTLKDLKKNY